MASQDNDVTSAMEALRSKYRDVELLMCDSKNVNHVLRKLREINLEFDSFMCATVQMPDADTLPGSVSHKIDIVQGNADVVNRVNRWIEGVEAHSAVVNDYVGVSEVSDSNACGHAGSIPFRSEAPRRAGVPDTTRSIKSSSSGSSRSSHIRESRVKVQLARLALQHEQERQQEATRERQRQLEMAEAELNAWETESTAGVVKQATTVDHAMPQRHTSNPLLVPTSPKPAQPCRFEPLAQKEVSYPNYFNGRPPESLPSCHGIQLHSQPLYMPTCRPNRESPARLPAVEGSERYLPKLSIGEFCGDPLDYWAFVNRYDVHIAARVTSDDLRLSYLLQHCSKEVYDKIKHHASGLDKRQAYEDVWKDLYERFGQPHIIGRCCEERLSEVSKIIQFDSDRLENLAVLMKRCLISLKHTAGSATINSVGFISSIANKLPFDMRKRWTSAAYKIQQRDKKIAVFDDFAKFVISESEEANLTFYRAIFAPGSHKSTISGALKSKTRAFNIVAQQKLMDPSIKDGSSVPKEELSCACCGQPHKLDKCKDFRSKTVSERKAVVRRKYLCFRCLLSGHGVKNCNSKRTCDVESCQSSSHHPLLHVDAVASGADPTPVCSTAIANAVGSIGRASRSFLDIVPVLVCCEEAEVATYALLDPGSSMSFCEPALIDALGLYGTGLKFETSVETLTTKCPERLQSKTFSFSVKSLDGVNSFTLSRVAVIERIPVNPESRNVLCNLESFDHLQGVTLPRLDHATVSLLIGNDHYLAQFPVETRISPDSHSSPHAIRTPLGWLLKGPNLDTNVVSPCTNLLLNGGRAPECVEAMEGLLVTEEGELISPSEGLDAADIDSLMSWLKTNREVREFGSKYSAEDVVAYDCMSKSIVHKDGHYQLPLLWKNASVKLPDSLDMAKRRLESVKRRLERDDMLKIKYTQEMQRVLDKGYAEVVPEEERDSSNRTWYIPHHPVLNPNKPDKVRIVYNCAAKSKGVSLNENLMKGPDLVNRLIGVLLRFRKERIAIVSDIEGMFHQVRCAPEDRDCLRFLWWPQGDLSKEPLPYRMTVHLFGAKSSPSCAAFALLETAKQFGKN